MLLLRSLIFWFIFIVILILFGTLFFLCVPVGAIFCAPLKREAVLRKVSYLWAYATLQALEHIVGLRYKIKGGHLINNQPLLLAAKHESTWETIFLLYYLDKASFVLKKELCYIPIYGWTLPLLGMLIIDRGEGVKSIKKIASGLAKIMREGRQLIVFPEGTRVPSGKTIPLKSGLYLMHKLAPKMKIVCAKLNSGKFWPKHAVILKPGVIEVTFTELEIREKIGKEELLQKVQNGIN